VYSLRRPASLRGTLSLRGALTAALVLAGVGGAAAQSPGPYDMRYAVTAETPLTADMDKGSRATGTLPAGADGIVLRWCRPEIPFATWQFGSPATWRKLLDERRCEIGWNGKVGTVDGSALQPVR
jgi:hypothetical protein